jgi:hypothetical protein
MCGVIWIIQLIHYPSFAYISQNQFEQFHTQHTTAMGLLVGPIMIVELIAGLWLMLTETNKYTVIHLLLVLTLWLLTFLVSVPLHNKLATGYNLSAIENLIKTNWPRTLLWTAKAGLTTFLVATNSTLLK